MPKHRNWHQEGCKQAQSVDRPDDDMIFLALPSHIANYGGDQIHRDEYQHRDREDGVGIELVMGGIHKQGPG